MDRRAAADGVEEADEERKEEEEEGTRGEEVDILTRYGERRAGQSELAELDG